MGPDSYGGGVVEKRKRAESSLGMEPFGRGCEDSLITKLHTNERNECGWHFSYWAPIDLLFSLE